jgi:hypothetical protein
VVHTNCILHAAMEAVAAFVKWQQQQIYKIQAVWLIKTNI